ncbi:unnamed protein product, partial [Musa acuminata var. zebrina]
PNCSRVCIQEGITHHILGDCNSKACHCTVSLVFLTNSPNWHFLSSCHEREHAIEKEPSLALLSIWPPVWRCVFSDQCIMARVQ